LLSLVLLAARLAREWEHRSWVWDSVRMEFLFAPNFGANQETAMLVGPLVLLLIVVIRRLNLESRSAPRAPRQIQK
jgi:hypothetical protein